MLKTKRILPNAKAPQKAHPSDAGFDLFAHYDETLTHEPERIETGIAVAIPPGYVGIICEKSGLAYRHRVQIMGGIIDSNFRGQVQVIAAIKTHDIHASVEIKAGDKIAQLIVVPIHPDNSFTLVEELDETDRGANGFGSTGAQ